MRPRKSHSKLEPGTIEAWLVSDDENDQRLATESLLRLGKDNQKAFYVRLSEREVHAYTERINHLGRRFIYTRIGTAVVMFMAALIFQLSLTGHPNSLIQSAVILICMAVGMAFSVAPKYLFDSPDSLLQKKVRENLLRYTEFADLPTLVQEARASAEAFQDMTPTLTALLPRMTPEHRNLLSLDEWDFLGKLLTLPEKSCPYPLTPELKRAIVHGIGKTGVKRMRYLLEPVAKAEVKTAEDEQLRQLAQNYLLVLPQSLEDYDNVPNTLVSPTMTSTYTVEQEPIRQQTLGRG